MNSIFKNDILKISICVPIYGVENYIEKCARSLFEQTYSNIEYIFVDDGSPDQSIGKLKLVINDYPERFKYIKIITHTNNRGLAAARNTSIAHATGDFILCVDADDSIDTHLVEKLVAKQQEKDADIVCFDIKVLFNNRVDYIKNGDYINGRDLLSKMLVRDAPHPIWGHLIRRSILTDNKIQCVEGVNQSEDYQVMIQIAYFANIVTTLHEALYIYNMKRDSSYSNSLSENSFMQMETTADILNSFFIKHNEIELAERMYIGIIINLCRTKMGMCESRNWKMYDLVCQKIEKYKPRLKQTLPFKYILLSEIKTPRFFKYLICLRKIKK